jgi:hypothetical protein
MNTTIPLLINILTFSPLFILIPVDYFRPFFKFDCPFCKFHPTILSFTREHSPSLRPQTVQSALCVGFVCMEPAMLTSRNGHAVRRFSTNEYLKKRKNAEITSAANFANPLSLSVRHFPAISAASSAYGLWINTSLY